MPTLEDLRSYALRRSLFGPTTLARAVERLGFVQADPIRAPARAQDVLPAASLASLLARLRYAAPQWRSELKAALARAQQRLTRARVAEVDWYWPAGERVRGGSAKRAEPRVRLLSPFDPVVWDRRRFELFWGWRYRFEAYTPVHKRKLGYYALPLLWNEDVVGWGNLSVVAGRLSASFGYVSGKAPRGSAFREALEAELGRFEKFLGVEQL